ncbi:MAG TPA: ribonuclease P protein component [Pyrinomonadaceae bacterium]|nr:ribonuclease P protein component [Pyrinomonadaceae bacterium]
MSTNLRGSNDFQRVYKTGKRYEGHLLTVFVLPNSLPQHRLGITASRKALGKAVDRNRAKRLLREAFRLTRPHLDRLTRKYDWVLNARRSLLSLEGRRPSDEFEMMIAKVASDEAAGSVVEAQLV